MGHPVTLDCSHGPAHQRGPGGLHPHGPDQHGGVPQEFENKVRPVKLFTIVLMGIGQTNCLSLV